MNVMNIKDFKDRMHEAIEEWGVSLINSFVQQHPSASVAAVYAKRGLHNYMCMEDDRLNKMIDNAAIFIANEHGEVNVNTLYDDMISLLCTMEETSFDLGLCSGCVGQGQIKINLPDNFICNMLFGNAGAVKITKEDFLELKNMILE